MSNTATIPHTIPQSSSPQMGPNFVAKAIVKFKATPSSLLSYRFFKNETLYRNGVEDEFSTLLKYDEDKSKS